MARAWEKERSDLVSHPAAAQAADSDPGPASPALTLHFLQSGLRMLSLGSASASGLGRSSLSQETSTPFTALLEWPGRLNPYGPALILTEGFGATRSTTKIEESLFTLSKPLFLDVALVLSSTPCLPLLDSCVVVVIKQKGNVLDGLWHPAQVCSQIMWHALWAFGYFGYWVHAFQ